MTELYYENMPRGCEWKAKELETYIKLYNESMPLTVELSNQVEDLGVNEVLRSIITQIQEYIGTDIPNIPSLINEFKYSHESVKQILKDEDVPEITFSELKEINPFEYYKLLGYGLRLIKEDEQYDFIEL